MGNAIKAFAKIVAKGAISAATGVIPVIGGPLGNFINSKFAVGSFDVGSMGIDKADIPDGVKTKTVNTPAQLKALVKANPEEASKAGLTVSMIDEEVKKAKEQAKAIGGTIRIGAPRVSIPEATNYVKPAFSKGTKDLNKVAKSLGAVPKGQAKGKSTVSKADKKEMEHMAEIRGMKGVEAKSKLDSKATGGKVKRPRTQAQLDATKRLVEANRKRRAEKHK